MTVAFVQKKEVLLAGRRDRKVRGEKSKAIGRETRRLKTG
jgi:hypothetical protein